MGKVVRERDTKFQDLTFKEKIEHIWEYYKLVLVGIFAGICLIAYIIKLIFFPDPKPILTAALVNATSLEIADPDYFTRYLTENGYDPEEYTVALNTNLSIDGESINDMTYNSCQVLMAMMTASELDLLVGNEDAFKILGCEGSFYNMDELMTPEQIEQYKDRIYTVKDINTGEDLMCAIWLTEKNPLMMDGYYFVPMLAGIPYTTESFEVAQEMLLELLEE